MEDRDVSGHEDHSNQCGQLSANLHDNTVSSQELSKLCAVFNNGALPWETTQPRSGH